MNRLLTSMRRDDRVVVGLMSGTSCDGIDAAVVRIMGCGTTTKVDLLSFLTVPFPTAVREVLFHLFKEDASVDVLCAANAHLGELFAKAALQAVAAADLEPADVDIIGSHGQTIRHLPGGKPGSTLQIGDPSVIAVQTGITTVGDFRPADMAAGGQGAPLLPMVDRLLYSHPSQNRLLLNIGGISNVAVLPPEGVDAAVIAFDLGPGNMAIDAAIVKFTEGASTFDKDGARAAEGRVDAGVLDMLLQHPFFAAPPPKSTGREDFGEQYVAALLEAQPHLECADVLATLTALTSRIIVDGLQKFVLARQDRGEYLEMYVSGGGVHNPLIMEGLRKGLPSLRIEPFTALGMNPDAREAMAFAVLANETICGNQGNLCSATGASHPVSLGKICLAL